MKALLAWLKETTDQAGPDFDSITFDESGSVTIRVSIASNRTFIVARELSDAGHTVTLLNGEKVMDFNQEHYGLAAR